MALPPEPCDPIPAPATHARRRSGHQRALSTRDEWERRIGAIGAEALGLNPFAEILLRHLPVQPAWSAIEIGAIPGRFLLFLHKAFGYRVCGLDYARDWSSFDEVMRAGGVAGVEKIAVDFLSFASTRTFDVVSSFGFIEHFDDVPDIVHRHARLVSPGGFLVLSVPNFTRLQYLYHWLVDRPNLRLHNPQAMDRRLVERLLVREGFHVRHSGYVGRAEVWRESQRLAWWQRVVEAVCRRVVLHLGRRLPASAWYSPYLLLIAQRQDPA